MPKGYSDNQIKARILTNAKIAATLSVEPLRYSHLQEYTKIQTKRLKDRLEQLVYRDIVFKHNFSFKEKVPSIDYGATYYLLNWNNIEAKELVDYWFVSGDLPISVSERIERSNSAKMIYEYRDMLKQFCEIDKSHISEEEFDTQINLFFKNARILDLLYVCECKLTPTLHFYFKALPMHITYTKMITDLLAIGYTYNDILIKLCADHKSPYLFPYIELWELMMKDKQQLLMIGNQGYQKNLRELREQNARRRKERE